MQLPCYVQEHYFIPARRDEWWLEDMAWAARVHSKGRIDRAGRELADMSLKPEPTDYQEWVEWSLRREEEIKVLDNWRACHAYPLQVIKMTLLNRAKKIDRSALIAQRLKRRPSIEIKLRDNPNMNYPKCRISEVVVRFCQA